MKIRTILLLIAFTLPALTYGQDDGEITVPLSDPAKRAKVTVDLRKGSIRVIGTQRSDILVKYAPQPGKKSNETRSDGLRRIGSAALDLEISENNNNVNIESSSWNKGVNVEVEVPSNVDLHVETYNNGDIFVENIQGEVVADNYNGKITAERIAGSLVADTYNGAIKVTFTSITSNTPMAFTTYNGDVDLTFPASFKANLKMKTSQGDIYSGFDFEPVKSGPVTKKEGSSSTTKIYLDEWIKGAVNGGGPEVMIKNYNGDIYLRKG